MLASTGSGGHSFVTPIIDVLDKVSLSLTTDPRLRLECLLALDKVCAVYGILPTRCPRINNLAVTGDGPKYFGGSADVWRGQIDGRPVAVKVTRRYLTVPISQARERCYQEVLAWARLSHPNILTFLGIDTQIFPFAVVSAWMQHGNLKESLLCFPNVSRLKLMLDASRGLEYMHRVGYIHGNVKSLNVLVDDSHSARLANFGSSSLLPLLESGAKALPSHLSNNGFSVRWLAPELIDPEGFGLHVCVRSKESDVYALAMLMYETFSGLFPFEEYRDEGVILQVISGARPSRPQNSLDLGLSNGVWTMIQECWGSGDRRWAISRIVSYLETSVAPAKKVVVSEGRINKLFDRVNQLICIAPTKRTIPRTNGWLHKGRL